MGIFNENPFLQQSTVKDESNIFVDLLQTIVIALSICVIIYLFIVTPNEVHGESMEPNFHDRELLLTNKVVQLLGNTGLRKVVGDYKRGDVVIFKHTLSEEDFIKRIIAVEGDTIMIQSGDVYINDINIEEPYLPEGRQTESGNFLTEGNPQIVPDDAYAVLGDNRSNSTDSRSNLVRFVKRSQLKGKVIFRYWPLDSFGIVHGHRYQELESYNNPSSQLGISTIHG